MKNDLISRQAAIDVLKNRWKKTRNYEGIGDDIAEECELYLKQVPSAQPECEDAVSRFEVLRLIDYSSHDLNDAVDNRYMQNEIKQLPSVTPKQPGWIPCDVRTPKHVEESYWICTDTGYQCQCRWTNNVFGLGARDEWGWKLLDIPQYSKVVAWMPLPEPYKERRTDG